MGAILRTLRVAASGLLTGLLLGTLGLATLVAANVWDDRRRMGDTADEPAYLSAVWSALAEPRFLPYWAAVGAAGAANGGVGAWAALRGNRGTAPVIAIPLLLLLFPLAVFVQYPSGSKSWGGRCSWSCSSGCSYGWREGSARRWGGGRGRPNETLRQTGHATKALAEFIAVPAGAGW